MSRNQFTEGTRSGGSVLGRCKKNIANESIEVPDTDDAEADVVIIEAPESSYWGSSCSRRKRISSRCIINIDDEDEAAGVGPSTTSYGDFRTTPIVDDNTQERSGSRNRVPDSVSDSSDSESIESSFFNTGTANAQDSDDDSSDCEILEDTSGSIREQWEQAALRRRMPGLVRCDSDDEVSGSSSSAMPGTQEDEIMDDAPNVESCPNEIHLEQVESEFLNAEGGSNTDFMHTEPVNSSEMADRIFEEASCRSHQSSDNGFMPTVDVSSAEVEGQIFEEASAHHRQSPQYFSSHGVANQEKEMPFVEQASCFYDQSTDEPNLSNRRDCSKQFEEDHLVEQTGTSYSGNFGPYTSSTSTTPPFSGPVDVPGMLAQLTTSEDYPNFQDSLVVAREKHKESAEYKRAQEEEWASRQKQLQIQAEEARRLRRKKKAESDMAKRQKQRLEEIRETQRKNEETLNLKEQFRVQVRKELEQMERQHYSMGSLLRGLGITVEGGLLPSTSEVKAAYKRALLRFHPDRVSKSDIHEQVRAEETFKFISRLKEKLRL